MPSSHLICRPLLLLPPIPLSIRVFSNESTLHMRWPKYWSFSFSISPSNDTQSLSCDSNNKQNQCFLKKNKILANERYLEHQPGLHIKELLLHHLVRLTSSSPLPVFTLYLRFILPLIISPFRGFIISSQSGLTTSGIHHNTGKHYNCYQKSVFQEIGRAHV